MFIIITKLSSTLSCSHKCSPVQYAVLYNLSFQNGIRVVMYIHTDNTSLGYECIYTPKLNSTRSCSHKCNPVRSTASRSLTVSEQRKLSGNPWIYGLKMDNDYIHSLIHSIVIWVDKCFSRFQITLKYTVCIIQAHISSTHIHI